MSSGGRTPYRSTSVLRMTPVVAIGQRRRVDRLAGRRIEEVLGRAQDQRDVAVELGELDDFGLLGVDREGDDLLLAVERCAGLSARRRLAFLA